MVDPKTGRVISQEDWKRTQVRMPQEQYDSIVEYAKNSNLSLNSAFLELMDRGMLSSSSKKDNANIVDSKDEHFYRKEIYNQIKDLDFIKDLEEKYEQKLDILKIKVEYLDVFGQCHVYLNFEDNFAIRDASGNWSISNASDCCEMTEGRLIGMQTLE